MGFLVKSLCLGVFSGLDALGCLAGRSTDAQRLRDMTLIEIPSSPATEKGRLGNEKSAS